MPPAEPEEPANRLDAALLAYDEALRQGRVSSVDALGPCDLNPDERAALRAQQRCVLQLASLWPRDAHPLSLDLHSEAVALSDACTQDAGPQLRQGAVLSDIGRFREAVVNSGIITREDLQLLLADLSPDQQPQRVEQLIYELMQREILNRDQAAALYRAELTKLVLGPFLIVEELGRGGMGIVYRALNQRRNRYVALKMLYQSGGEAIARLKLEFRALANVIHPNLVALDELYSIDGRWFITMEWIDGVPATEYVRGGRSAMVRDSRLAPTSEWPPDDLPPPVEGALQEPSQFTRLRHVLVQLAEGLSALHLAGKLHRDIKPSNVLVAGDGRVVLVDYGLVIDLAPGATQEDVREAAGTWAYMSPEQSTGQPLSPASDWYSVGVMLYEILMGQRPFSGTFDQVLAGKRQEPPSLPAIALTDENAELVTLAQDLLHPDPDRRPTADEVRTRLGCQPSQQAMVISDFTTATDNLFVGRAEELEQLRETLLGVQRGHAVSVYVEGPSGIGKTALVSHFLKRLEEEQDVLTLRAKCHEREAVPYKALDGIIDALRITLSALPTSQLVNLLPDESECLIQLFPVLGALRRHQGELTASPIPQERPEVRRRAVRELRQLFRRLARWKTIVLFADDLQWGDTDSAVLLNDLLGASDAPPLLFVGCYRTEDVQSSPFLQALRNNPLASGSAYHHRMTLHRMNADDSRQLAAAILREEPAAATVCPEDVMRESGGHPFFLTELARHLPSVSGQEPRKASEVTISWESMLVHRVNQLPEVARELLHVVAVAGHPLSLDEAYRAIRSTPKPRMAILLKLARLIRTTGGRHTDQVTMYHDRIRETITCHLPIDQRRDYHARLATTLEVTRPTEPDILCTHFEAAGEGQKACHYGLLAAERAAETMAFDRAAQLYRFVLGSGTYDAAEECVLRRKLADALANAGQGAQAAEQYLAVADRCAGIEAVEFQRQAADQLLRCGHYQEGRRILVEALAAVGLKLPKSRSHAVLTIFAGVLRLWLSGRRLRHREEVRISREELVRTDMCRSAAYTLCMTDGLGGVALFPQLELLARRAGESGRVAMAMALAATWQTIRAGRCTAKTLHLFETAEALAQRHNDPFWTGFVKLMRGEVEFFLGQWRRAVPFSDEAESILRENCTGVFFELAILNLDIITSLYFLGQVKELSQRLPEVIRDADQRRDRFAAVAPRTYFGNIIWLAADQVEEARREAELAMVGWPRTPFLLQHIFELIGSVSIDLYAGDGSAAWDRCAQVWPEYQRSGQVGQPFLRVILWHLRARAALAAIGCGGDDRALIRLSERTAKRILREPRPWAHPLASLVLAAVARARGREGEAVETLRGAVRECEAWEIALYAAAAKRCLGQLVGGDEGQALIAAGDQFMAAQDIRSPERMTRMLIPGLA